MSEPHRNSRLAAKKRDAMMLILGNRCAKCGTRKDLEFDLIIPTAEAKSHHENLNWLTRMNFYVRHMQVGNVQLLCSSCNSAKSTASSRYIAKLVIEGREVYA